MTTNSGSPQNQEVRVDSVSELFSAIEEWKAPELFFRGQENVEWPLKPRYLRICDHPDVQNWTISRPDAEIETVRRFQQVARGMLRDVPDLDDLLGWRFIMQHYGVPTRLLDWMVSPYGALYFACKDVLSDEKPKPVDGALWILNSNLAKIPYWYQARESRLMRAHQGGGFEGGDRIEFSREWYTYQRLLAEMVSETRTPWPLVVEPQVLDQRMLAQGARFTLMGDALTLEQIASPACLPRHCILNGAIRESPPELRCRLGDSPMLAKRILSRIVFPGEIKMDVLRRLHRMNVHAGSLFPGLDGIGMHVRACAILGIRLDAPFQDCTVTLPTVRVAVEVPDGQLGTGN